MAKTQTVIAAQGAVIFILLICLIAMGLIVHALLLQRTH